MASMLTIGLLVGGVTTIAGGILGGIGAMQEHEQAKANAEMQAEMMERNKRLEEREAARVEAVNAENVRRQRLESEQLKARQRALLGKSGAAMNSGSPLAILGATAADEELKAQDLHYSGYQEAQQHRERAKTYQYQAGVARAQAPSDSSLILSLAGRGLSTAGSLAQLGASGYSTYQAVRR